MSRSGKDYDIRCALVCDRPLIQQALIFQINNVIVCMLFVPLLT